MKKLFLYLTLFFTVAPYLQSAALWRGPQIDVHENMSGKCTIAAYFKEAERLSAAEIPADEPWKGSIGRIEISWKLKPGKVPSARIEHLEVEATHQRSGAGSALFKSAIDLLVCGLGITNISWAAQPLDPTLPLERLIYFYKKLGGETVQVHDEYCASMKLSKKKIIEITGGKISSLTESTDVSTVPAVLPFIPHPFLHLAVCDFSIEPSPKNIHPTASSISRSLQ